MFIASKKPHRIGDKGHGAYPTSDGKIGKAPFVVLREATFEDWLKQGLEAGFSEQEMISKRFTYFYEVSVD